MSGDPSSIRYRRGAAPFGALLLLTAAGAAAADPVEDERWELLRATYFADRAIEDAGQLLGLEAPKRAQDAAIVPLKVLLSPELRAKKLTLIVDDNPVPLAAAIDLGEASAPGALETRVRVNEYTNVRAVAETEDGRLLMTSRYIKAAGGCSAPALKDPAQSLARMGKMKMNLPDRIPAGSPVTAQLLISHPNNSGLQFDQVSRFFIPPHYIRSVSVSYNGKPVLEMTTDISISEDPNFQFSFVPEADGMLEVRAVDTKDKVFTESWPVKVAPAS
ncbi:quinoprotein dehydrogenase-associated SoxYZ-like carrier [Arenibaculum pallidiluteum]|uniref:quinoprotein dehydrogenase-associated SoxYZ-like carrier n=1 Tax=Arenibaculum pallidiluteum TaxID=2812559 RepID=UPI001A96C6A0|nr:quinoprotein dehydrogenase-associated SoxYZ-like carrier [Arenibaculum pallidiluteum]